jgi:hypothetical protein
MRSKPVTLLLPILLVLLVSSSASAASLILAWDRATDRLTTGYILSYGTVSGVYDTEVDVGFVTSYEVKGLADGTTYFFVVRAYDAKRQTSEMSREVSGLTPGVRKQTPPPPPPPPPPSNGNLRGALRSDRFIDLAWTAPTDYIVTGYRVEVGTAPGHTGFSALTRELGITFDIADLPAATYYIRLRELVNGAFRDPSNELVIQANGPPTDGPPNNDSNQCSAAPGPPRQFVAGSQGALVRLGWQRGAGDSPSAYVLQVGSAPGRQDIITLPLPGAATLMEAMAATGRYALRMTASNACGMSLWGAEAVLDVGTESRNLPGAPQSLTHEVAGDLVSLTWAPPVTGDPVTRYVIEAETGGLTYAFDTGSTLTTFTNANTAPGRYVVRVRAGNSAGLGPASVAVTVVVP